MYKTFIFNVLKWQSLPMDSTTGLAVKRFPESEGLLHPGDYVFVCRRAPIRNVERIAIDSPNIRQGPKPAAFLGVFGKTKVVP